MEKVRGVEKGLAYISSHFLSPPRVRLGLEALS